MRLSESGIGLSLVPSRNHRSDFDPIFVVEHFILSHKFISANHEVSFNDEIQLFEEILGLLRPFDFDGARGMTELDVHGRMICRG